MKKILVKLSKSTSVETNYSGFEKQCIPVSCPGLTPDMTREIKIGLTLLMDINNIEYKNDDVEDVIAKINLLSDVVFEEDSENINKIESGEFEFQGVKYPFTIKASNF